MNFKNKAGLALALAAIFTASGANAALAADIAYVKHGIIIGMDSIKQIMVNAMLMLGGRKNMGFAPTREEAVERLLIY